MTDTARDAANEDRLPWLEAVDENDDASVSSAKLIGFIIVALLALGLVIGGIWLLRQRSAATAPVGDPKLIAAQEGDYKVRPDAPGGMKVEGRGDSSFAASEGAEANGKIDLNALPEAPVRGERGATAAATPGTAAKPVAKVAVPASSGRLVAAAPIAAPVRSTSATPGGRLVQLGAYGSQAKAEQAWTSLTKRFAYLTPLTKSVLAAEVGGSTVYRLRADAGGDAANVCGKLKVAGENCLIVS